MNEYSSCMTTLNKLCMYAHILNKCRLYIPERNEKCYARLSIVCVWLVCFCVVWKNQLMMNLLTIWIMFLVCLKNVSGRSRVLHIHCHLNRLSEKEKQNKSQGVVLKRPFFIYYIRLFFLFLRVVLIIFTASFFFLSFFLSFFSFFFLFFSLFFLLRAYFFVPQPIFSFVLRGRLHVLIWLDVCRLYNIILKSFKKRYTVSFVRTNSYRVNIWSFTLYQRLWVIDDEGKKIKINKK